MPESRTRSKRRRFPKGRCLTPMSPLALHLVAALSIGSAVAQSNTIGAVEPGGRGVLTKCFGWLVAGSCRTYHHLSLPSRIAIGDTITLTFGSSTKTYGFSVARIALHGDHCEIFSQADAVQHRRDKIDVAPCYPADDRR
jgi:hypothetical protein